MSLLILDWWACSSWGKCKRLLQPLLYRCIGRRGASSGTSASRLLAYGLFYENVPLATPSRGAPVLEQKLLYDVARPSTQRYIWAIHLWLVWPSALVGGKPMRRTLYLKPCACLLANQAGEVLKSQRLWRQGGDVLEPRECRLPNVEVTGRFLQPLCSPVVLDPPMPLIMHAGGPWCLIKGCESFLHLSYQLRKFCSTHFLPFK